MMNRRNFIAAVAALPILGKIMVAKPKNTRLFLSGPVAIPPDPRIYFAELPVGLVIENGDKPFTTYQLVGRNEHNRND